jgi:DNA-binding NarL/FixJ family response regulator
MAGSHITMESIASYRITSREFEVLRLLREGFSDEMIARRLNVSIHTVRTHQYHLRKKFDVHSRLALIRKVELAGIQL